MRIIFDFNEMPQVEELTYIAATPGWRKGHDANKQPDDLTLFVMRAGEEQGEYIGEWDLDGTPEAWKEVKQNYMEIAEKALTKGYIRASDFKRFKWW